MSAGRTALNPRQRSNAEKLARRKRTIVACQFCRLRKTRCDGVRPVCGFCRHHDAQCIWSSDGAEYDGTPAEREILQRLDDIKLLLHSSTRPPVPPSSQAPLVTNLGLLQELPASPGVGSSPATSQVSTSNSMPSPYPVIVCESILRWPILQELVDPPDAAVESYVLESEPTTAHATPAASGAGLPQFHPGNGIQEHLFVPLCRKFLAHVHLRNPVLESSQLILYAKNVSENGLEWNASSCLVLLACALASYTTPWDTNDQFAQSPGQGPVSEEEIACAEAYYLAAKKRIGLLGHSIIDIQCLFFASIFEKYALNPLQAWFYIQQASSRLQAHFGRHRRSQAHESVADRHLEQRIFWSVYKAEHELLPELGLASSGIENLTRPESMFPSPPTIELSTPASSNDDNLQEERSWFFYLAEISLRRTINDTLWLLYRNGEQYWISHIDTLVQQHEESERQISLWYSHLPMSIRFDPLERPDNELSFYLQGRFHDWREYILRPLVYYVLHQPRGRPTAPQVLTAAQQGVFICANIILYNNRQHRHGGTWFGCRRSFACALIIVAVAVKADEELPPPPNWRSLIDTAISTLHKWESQATDIRDMRLTLHRIMQNFDDKMAT